MDVSVVIPVYNSEKTVRECVLSILDSDFDGNFEILVVDDGSTDTSMEKIKGLNVQIIRQENKGAGAARNNGARQAASDIIIFADSDVVFLKDTLRRIYEHLQKDDVDYVTVRYSKKPLNDKWIHKYKALADFSYYYDFLYAREKKQKPIRHVLMYGGTKGYKKKVFQELGGYDERIKGAHIEEEMLVLKLSRNYKMVADASIKTRHYFPDFGKLVKTQFRKALHLRNAMHQDNYRQPYLDKNILRVALGGLTVVSLIFSLAFDLIFGSAAPFIATGIIFLGYFLSHWRMFFTAVSEHGIIFTLYCLIVNLFFCTLISLAGFLSTVKYLVQKR